MKTITRFLVMLLAVLMIAGAAMTVSAFPDIEDGYKHATAINTLTQLGIINGYEDGTFKPNDPVERDEMAKLVFVLYTTMNDAGNGIVKFNDVDANHWASGFISWCSAKNIVGGYGDDTFRPDGEITYDEALKMTCAMLGYTDFESALWPVDVRQTALRDLDLGKDIDANGSDKLTRGEVAQLLYNALSTPMNETKVEYVYDNSYVDGNGGSVAVKVPVKVAKVLAKDVWGYEEVKVTVNSVTDNKINGDLTLVELGLESYSETVTELIGLDISYLVRDNEILANAVVLGYRNLVKVENVYDTEDTDVIDVNYIIVDGNKYKVDEITINCNVTDLVKPNIALGVDKDGDGKFESITVGFLSLMDVTNEQTKGTGKDTYIEYTVSGDKYTSDKVAGAAISKNDVIVATVIDSTLYVDAIVKPVVASATKIGETTITLDTIGEVKFNDPDGILNAAISADYDVLFALNADKERIVREFYIYNNTIVRHTAIEETLPDVKIGVFFGITEVKETLINNKIDKAYVGKLIVDGKIIEATIIDYDNYVLDDLMIKDTNGDSYIDNYYYLVNYVVDKNGNYHLYNSTTKENVSVVTGSMSVNKNTGLYTIGNNTKIELVKDTVMFYTYTEDTGFTNLGTYTDNIPTIFETKDNVTAYVVENEDGYFTLLAAIFENELVIPEVAQNKTHLNDGRLIVYAYSTPAKVFKDEAYFEYYFIDCATLEKFTIISETSIADGASEVEAGKFYGWDASDKKYVQVTTANTDAVKVGTITDIDTTRDILYIDGVSYTVKGETVNFADGYKLPADINIFSTAKNNPYEYATFDIASLAELFELAKDNEKVLDAAVGIYFDEDGNLGFAWIIVDNYYYVTSNDEEVLTQTSDIVSRIDAQ